MTFVTRSFVLFLLLAGFASGQAADSSSTPLRQLSGPEFDQSFLRQMIMHHHRGVQLAQLAVQNAQRDELKDFARQTSVVQQREIRELETLRTGRDTVAERAGEGAAVRSDELNAGVEAAPPPAAPRFEETAPSAVSPEAQAHQQRLERLNSTNAENDNRLVDELLDHHSAGLEMAQLARDRASAGAVRRLGDQLAHSQSAEVQKLQRLRSALPR